MSREIRNELGVLHIADDVIATVAGVAATECYGVVGMASTRLTDGLAELLGRENLARGVNVHVADDAVTIELSIIVGYGTRISEVAQNVRRQVRYAVEQATGAPVRDVKVNVQGVRAAGER